MKYTLKVIREEEILLPPLLEAVKGGSASPLCTNNTCEGKYHGPCTENKCEEHEGTCNGNRCGTRYTYVCLVLVKPCNKCGDNTCPMDQVTS